MSLCETKKLRILSLDGGGVKGLSSLLVLERIFRTIQRDNDLSEVPRPCDYFDLIGGTSTGGLIAIMLGRLRMTIAECLVVFESFSRDVFGRGNPPGTLTRLLGGAIGRPFFDKDHLEAAVKSLLRARGLDEDLPLRDSNEVPCKVFVCATTTETLHRELLRSYTTREVSESDYDCHLWEAARATTAAPLFFEPITLRASGVTLVDGAMRFNNPIYEVLNEAEQLYPGISFDCIVSLGTGWSGVQSLGDSHLKGYTVLQTCVDLAINAHNEAERFAGDKRGEELLNTGRYFRFDVDHGIDTVALDEWTKLPKIRAHTARYLARTNEKRNLEDCAKRLCGRELGSPSNLLPNNSTSISFKSTLSSYSNPNFSGRTEYFFEIDQCFAASDTLHQRVAVWGLGGIGKSQIAHEYARRRSSECSTFWVRANSMDNFLAGYLSIGRDIGVKVDPEQDQKTMLKSVKHALESKHTDPWLMVLDEADEKEQLLGKAGSPGLMEYLPRSKHGQILITTRDSRVVGLADGQVVPARNGIRVGPLPHEQGIELFHKSVRDDLVRNSTPDDIMSFIKMLGGLPLAIVQAAAFIREEGVSIDEFTKLYEDVERHEELFQEHSISTDLEQKSVLYTWEVSYRRIAGPEYPASKSPAAMVLDLLGFLDAQDTGTRTLNESQNEALATGKDVKIYNFLDHVCGPQESPKHIVSAIYRKHAEGQNMLSTAIGRLRNYSLVNSTDCWMHPVVHSWIYRRLPLGERHQYISWVFDELYERVTTEYEHASWCYALFKFTSKLDVNPMANLSPIRNARVLLGFALSPTMIRYRSETQSSIPKLADFLCNIARELSVLSHIEEAVCYLEAAVREAKSLPNSPLVVSRAELDYLKMKGRLLDPHQATKEAREFHSSRAYSVEAHIWLAECLLLEGLIWDGANEAASIELMNPLTSETMDDQKPLVALKISAASALGELGDVVSRDWSRRLMDEVIELISGTYHGHITKVILGLQAFRWRLELATEDEDRIDVCRRIAKFEQAEEMTLLTILGGCPDYWNDYLKEMQTKEQWASLEAFARTYTESRVPLLDMLKYRAKKKDKYTRIEYVGQDMEDCRRVELTDGYANTAAGWAQMYNLLGQAYVHLSDLDAAEASFWMSFVLYLFAASWMTLSDLWMELLHHLAACLHQQGSKRQEQLGILMSSYSRVIRQSETLFGPISQKFRSNKRNFDEFSDGRS